MSDSQERNYDQDIQDLALNGMEMLDMIMGNATSIKEVTNVMEKMRQLVQYQGMAIKTLGVLVMDLERKLNRLDTAKYN